MKICVLYPQVSMESAKELADAMGWDCVNPFKEARRDFRMYDGVFNYGCNRQIVANNVINKTKSVATCINKTATFEAFKAAGIPTVAYTTRKADVPKEWDCVVIRQKIDGHKAEGLDYFYQNDERIQFNRTKEMPDGALFTQGFDHVSELRVVVLFGIVVGCYQKVDNNGQWDFVDVVAEQPLLEHAKKAAKALDIDYVGFDVLVNEKGVYVFLEANSGPIITEDVIKAVKGYIK